MVPHVACASRAAAALPERAGGLADAARARGLAVRGVMGYEGQLMLQADAVERERGVARAMELLLAAHREVGGEVVSAGGTGTYAYAINRVATEIQAGSYALMDTAYAAIGLPFRPSLSLLARVISVSANYAVADCGLKALGTDHGNPEVPGARVWFCSDEHLTFAAERKPAVGDRIRVLPAHIDPTLAYHERLHLVDGEDVLETWPIDLRGW